MHYTLPPEPRLPDARRYIDRGAYFVVHAPRQTGKTTTLQTMARHLTADGLYVAVRFSCETAEPWGDDIEAAERVVLGAIARGARSSGLKGELLPPDPWPEAPAGRLLVTGLAAWADRCPRLLVLFFDEIDALRDESLRSVLRQLRDGYTERPTAFPHSVVLCGLRDVRDYKATSGGDPSRLGSASPFNIKLASLRLGDFDFDDVAELYAQHTAETGQVFTDDAVALAFEYTQGQPWLVNALANEITFEMEVPLEEPITAKHAEEAKERLILARATHLDSLVNKLNEARVERVVEPLLAGDLPEYEVDDTYDDDVAYTRDLGLVAADRPVRIANPIYREVIVRVLGGRTKDSITADPHSFVAPDGRLDFEMLLREFTGFWIRHGDVLANRRNYNQAAPQLVIMAYLERIVNGGGLIEREYGVGMGRIDLHLRWPYRDADGKRQLQEEAIELKVRHPEGPDPLDEGLEQLDRYLDRLGLDEGTLVIFDRRQDAPPIHERTGITATRTPEGHQVTLVRG